MKCAMQLDFNAGYQQYIHFSLIYKMHLQDTQLHRYNPGALKCLGSYYNQR